MNALPTDDHARFELVLGNQAPLWRLYAEVCGGQVLDEEGGVQAAIIPAAPNRSFFNAVWYRDASGLLEALPRLAEAYEEAGVNAWTVWTPAEDEEAGAGLAAAGHKLDGEPRTMFLELDQLRVPDPDPGLGIRAEVDLETCRRINETAYGYPAGDFPPMASLPGTEMYLADLEGETVGTVLPWDRGDDCEITFVATLPEARGRGVARRLLAHALVKARERGRLASTLIASPLGFPVYEALGYRVVGGLRMWERRKPS